MSTETARQALDDRVCRSGAPALLYREPREESYKMGMPLAHPRAWESTGTGRQRPTSNVAHGVAEVVQKFSGLKRTSRFSPSRIPSQGLDGTPLSA